MSVITSDNGAVKTTALTVVPADAVTITEPKTVTSLNLTFENNIVREAFETFVKNYKEPICQFLNTFLKTEGVPVDAFIDVTDNTIKVFQLAPDKGEVLYENTDKVVVLGAYTDVKKDQKYAVLENGALWLFLKESEGEPDMKIGQFKNLTDAVKDWNSTSVEDTVKQVREYQDKLKSGRKKSDKKID